MNEAKRAVQVRAMLTALFLAFSLAMVRADSPPAAPAVQAVLELNSGWKFQAGDDARWADPSFDDSKWATISLLLCEQRLHLT